MMLIVSLYESDFNLIIMVIKNFVSLTLLKKETKKIAFYKFRQCLDPRFFTFASAFCSFFFFFHAFWVCGYCSMNSNRNCWLLAVNSAHMHCLRTHKFHFLSTFSLKMGLTVLFTHLKIILLQCFQF